MIKLIVLFIIGQVLVITNARPAYQVVPFGGAEPEPEPAPEVYRFAAAEPEPEPAPEYFRYAAAARPPQAAYQVVPFAEVEPERRYKAARSPQVVPFGGAYQVVPFAEAKPERRYKAEPAPEVYRFAAAEPEPEPAPEFFPYNAAILAPQARPPIPVPGNIILPKYFQDYMSRSGGEYGFSSSSFDIHNDLVFEPDFPANNALFFPGMGNPFGPMFPFAADMPFDEFEPVMDFARSLKDIESYFGDEKRDLFDYFGGSFASSGDAGDFDGNLASFFSQIYSGPLFEPQTRFQRYQPDIIEF